MLYIFNEAHNLQANTLWYFT